MNAIELSSNTIDSISLNKRPTPIKIRALIPYFIDIDEDIGNELKNFSIKFYFFGNFS